MSISDHYLWYSDYKYMCTFSTRKVDLSMLTVLTFILIFGTIVTIHELGHFIAAKKSGVLVREFAIGMGPKIFSTHDKQGTLYSVRILPVGGYVRMAAPNEDQFELKPGTTVAIRLNNNNEVDFINKNKKEVDHTLPIIISSIDIQDDLYIKGYINGDESIEMNYPVSKTAMIATNDAPPMRIAIRELQLPSVAIWKQMWINFAGPLFNFILAVAVFAGILFSQGGMPTDSNTIGEISTNSAAQRAGLKSGDTITAIGSNEIQSWSDIAPALNKQNGQFTVTYKRNNDTYTTNVKITDADNGKLGVIASYDHSIFGTITGAFQIFLTSAKSIVTSIVGLFTNFNINNLGGPVAVYELSEQASSHGAASIFSLLAVLSLNIGLMNLIPIPAFDGGKLLLNILHAIRRKPLQQKTEMILTAVSALALLALMLVVTWNDAIRSFF